MKCLVLQFCWQHEPATKKCQFSLSISKFLAFVTYPISILKLFWMWHNARIKPPKIDPDMLQVQKPVILHERTVTSVKRNEVSALEIKTLAYNETLRTSCVTELNVNKVKQMVTKQRKSHQNYFYRIKSHGLDINCYWNTPF